jgi:hypothetical protein
MPNNNDVRITESPICVAIVLCNEVIEDKRTNNKTLVGLFNVINTSQLPAVHPRMFVMASLTNLRGRQKIVFSLKNPNNEEFARIEGEAASDDPLAVLDIVVELMGLPINFEGTHYIDILADNDLLSSRRFTVARIQPGPGQQMA